MDRRHEPRIPLVWMMLVAAVIAAPLFVLAQPDSQGGASRNATLPRAPGVLLASETALPSPIFINGVFGGDGGILRRQ